MLNNVSLMGRITRDLELKQTPNQKDVLSFTIAVDRDISGQNGEKYTDFIDCVAWNKTAEFIAKYFGKGRMIAVTGEIQTRTYTDKNGNKRKVTEINVTHAYFADSKPASNNAAPALAASDTYAYPEAAEGEFEDVADDEDLPF